MMMPDAAPAPFRLAVQGFAELLAAGPDPIMGTARVQPLRPAKSADLPMVAVTLRLDEPVHRGLGRLADGERPNPVPGEPPLTERWSRQFSGSAALEVWTASQGELVNVVQRLDERFAEHTTVRAHGFSKLEPAALGPAEHSRVQASSGSPFASWSQRLEYRFYYEAPPKIDAGGGIIDRIDVMISHDPKAGPEDQLVIPSPPVTQGG
jgi:hypothetical protein